MVGQLIFVPKGRGSGKQGRLYGLPVLRAEVDRSGFWGERRLRRAGRSLRLGGAARVLTPQGFDGWPVLEAFGLRRVDPELFVRAQSLPLTLEVLERQGLAPDRATVALRGLRADREMARTAAELCSRVRRLVVDAPRGGRELAQWLRREFGVPILPPGEVGQAALRFQEGCPAGEKAVLDLFGPRPDLAGLTLNAPALEEEDREDLSLLTVLWEGGRLNAEDIKIT